MAFRAVCKIWRDFIDSESGLWSNGSLQCKAASEGRTDIYRLIVQHAKNKNTKVENLCSTPLHKAQ